MVLPGDIVMSTVRTISRFYLLRPDPELTDAMLYILGHYAKVHHITLYGVCMMSTHPHVVYGDDLGNGPAFIRDVHRNLANYVKVLRGWAGSVFEKRPSHVRLLTPEAILDKLGYTLANPVAAGAVQSAKQWPGLCTRVEQMGGKPIRVERPKRYFDPKGKMPAYVDVSFALPPQLVELYGVEGTRNAICESIAHHETAARAEIHGKGWRCLSAQACQRISPFRRAKAYEVFQSRNPTFATVGGGKEAFFAAVKSLRAFRQAYRQALHRWRCDDRSVTFPPGTWLMRILHNVITCPPGMPAPA